MGLLTGLLELIDVPAAPIKRGGALTVARVIPTTGHALMGATYETMACSQVHDWVADFFCADPTNEQKLFDINGSWVEGNPFVVYAGVDCELDSAARNLDRARQALAYSERRQVDANITNIFLNDAVPWLAGTDLTSAIGIAEQGIGSKYGGEGIIWIPAEMVSEACKEGLVAATMDGRLMTCQGTPVANYIVAPGAQAVLYASGDLTLLQGPVIANVVPPSTSCDNTTTSPARALAERIYVPLYECAVGAIDFGTG